MATRVTNVFREDLTEPDPDLRITRIYLEVLAETPTPPIPENALVTTVIVQNV